MQGPFDLLSPAPGGTVEEDPSTFEVLESLERLGHSLEGFLCLLRPRVLVRVSFAAEQQVGLP